MSLEAAFAAFLGAVDRRQPCLRCERTTPCRCRVDDDERRKAREMVLKAELDKLVSIVRVDALRTVMAHLGRIHYRYRTAWTDAFDTCAGCNRGMELVPWPCPTWRKINELVEEATDCD